MTTTINIITGTSGDDTLVGTLGNDSIIGGSGWDFLSGGLGNDTLAGGEDRDFYFVNSGGDVIIEEGTASAEIDSVYSSVSYTLGDNLERLVLTGNASIKATGNALANSLMGNSSNNILKGGAGNDTISGGNGNDTAIINSNLAQAIFSRDKGAWVVSSADGSDTLRAIEKIQFNDGVISSPGGGEQKLNTNVDFSGAWLSGTAAFADGGYISAWEDIDDNPLIDAWCVYLQRYSTDGNVIGGLVKIDNTSLNDNDSEIEHNFSNLTTLDNGGFVVSFYVRSFMSNDKLHIRTFDSNNNQVCNDTLIDSWSSKMAAIDNGYIMVWSGYRDRGLHLFAQHFDNAGNKVGAEIQLSTLYNPWEYYSLQYNLTVFDNGDYVVVWESGLSDSAMGLYSQRFDSAGNKVGATTLLSSDGLWPQITSLSDGAYVITWTGRTGPDHNMNTFAQKFDSAGNKSGDEIQINSTLGRSIETVVTALDNGGFVIVMSVYYNDNTHDFYAQHFDSAGNTSGDPVLVNSSQGYRMGIFAVTPLANGGYVITWQNSDDSNGSGESIYSQHFDANGNPALPELVGNDKANTITFSDSEAVSLSGLGGNDKLQGGSGNDQLDGGSGNDILNGGTGNDTLTGGSGNDVYFVDSSLDVVRETGTLASETDTVKASASFTLGANIEHLVLTGTVAINGKGNTLDNTLTGNYGNNLLEGAGGNDLLSGSNGKDTLIGGAGIDTLQGGMGADVYTLDDIDDVIIETGTALTEIDTVNAGFSYTLGAYLEKLVLTGNTAINATGNALNNTLTGNTANNALTGFEGNDTLTGGAGHDTLTGGTGNDKFVISSLAGIDTITDFVSNADDIIFAAATIAVGDGDAALEGKLQRTTAGGFGASNELVIFTADIAGAISNSNAALAIGTANAAMVAGSKKLFVVDNGTQSNIYLFTSANGDAVVSGSELTLLATMSGVNDSMIADYFLQA